MNLEKYGLNQNGLSDNGSPYRFVPIKIGEVKIGERADGSKGYSTLEECSVHTAFEHEIVVISEDSDYCETIINLQDVNNDIIEMIDFVLRHYDDLTDNQKQLLRPKIFFNEYEDYEYEEENL